ncbi:phage portal protein [Inediibacterium massiliense]|uniref:phage portal protein n=1 Tax=Inediibacterium massiliense TaxID=1658111 RepID=UPI0006B69EF9|nr:phage portal protein [Inediibacterium massiliense]
MFERIFEKRNEETTLSNPASWFNSLFNGSITSSGEKISNTDSFNIGSVFACAERRANTISKLSLHTYKIKNNSKEREYKHPVVKLLENRPNPYLTPSVFKSTLSVHEDIWGNAYIWIESDKITGYPKALWILDPSTTVIYKEINTGVITYGALINNKLYTFDNDEIIHLKGLSVDGLVGKSRIEVARETLGNMKATSKFIGKFYAQGTMSGGILTYPEQLGKETKERIKDEWQKSHSGLDQAGKIALLDKGLNYKELGMPLKDAEFIESMKFNKEEIGMIFNIPPHKIGLLDRATFSNIEQQSMEYIGDSIQPVVTQWEEEFTYKLFSKNSRYYIKFNLASAMRANNESRANFYEKMMNQGVYSINDVRRFEDMNDIGELGDRHYRSLNYVDIEIADKYQLAKANANNLHTGGCENEDE